MHKIRRTVSLFLVLALALALVAGCAKQQEPAAQPAASEPQGQQSESPAAEPKQDVTLDVWIMPNSAGQGQDFLDVAKPWLDQNPHVTINVTTLDWGSAWTQITTAATSGEGPDILQLGTTWLPAIASMDALLPLTDRVAEIGGGDAYFPAQWKTVSIFGDSEIYGLPWIMDVRTVMYRKDVFQKAGVDPAVAFRDWDSFLAAMKQINDIEIDGRKIKAVGFPGKNDWNIAHNVIPWVWAAGGDALSPDNSRPVINSSAAVDGVMAYTNLVRENLVPLQVLEGNTAQAEEIFTNGDYAVMFTGPWMIARFRTSPDKGGRSDSIAAANFAVAPNPAGPTGTYTFAGGSNLSIFNTSDAIEESWSLLKYLSSVEGMKAYSQVSGFLPPRKDVFDDPFFKDDPAYNEFRKAAEFGRSYPNIAEWNGVEAVLNKHFGIIWDITAGVSGTYSRETIQAQLDEAAREIAGVLAQ